MEVKKKTITIDGEEVTASENWLKKIVENGIEEHKMELARNALKKEYQCSGCNILPRPDIKDVKKCPSCLKVFCNGCSSHQCPIEGYQCQANQSIQKFDQENLLKTSSEVSEAVRNGKLLLASAQTKLPEETQDTPLIRHGY